MSIFSARLKCLKAAKKLSSIDLAEHLGVTNDRIAIYENDIAEPSIDELIKMAKVFGVSVDYLIGMSNIPRPVFDVTSEEKEIIEKHREMAPKDKKIFMDILFNIFRA